MLLSKLCGTRFKEKPAEAVSKNHILLLRGGYIKQVAAGLYSLYTPALKVYKKIEQIVREEMNKIDGQEVLMPFVMPRDIWDESGRYSSIGKEMARFKDRNERDLVLGLTHEEAAVHMTRNENASYKNYPFMIYQFQTKFRDEARPRGGLFRVREFTMKDAYSFHTSQEDLNSYYEKARAAYLNAYKRIGLKNIVCNKSDTGMMGGKVADEFMLLCDAGEDTIVSCEKCKKNENAEVSMAIVKPATTSETKLEKVKTAGKKTIEEVGAFLNKNPNEMCKAVVYITEKTKTIVIAFIRADYEINEAKLSKIAKDELNVLTNFEDTGINPGFIGPINLGLKNKETIVVLDNSLKNERNLVCGANENDYHYLGFSPARDLKGDAIFADILQVREGDVCPICKSKYKFSRGVEVGNIFQLGDRYTKAMNMTYLDENGKKQTPIMGCYGFGLDRTFAGLVEESCDDFGPVWPKAVTPWHAHICVLGNDEKLRNEAFKIYEKLEKMGYECLIDDRNMSAGVQFSDADLLGIPFRIIFGMKNFADGNVELASRDKTMKKIVKLSEIEKEIKEFYL